ncbi:transcription initiation factor TFIID subunit 6b isoform X2 [Arabidopsis lyrata subsp. lyrata]|uniref:transcription initiation factor TFIID subunit 6b isoform X2 n=1 Tax=Arabidopsis lyrata subsp. lyrata TaxID=81972 RepID=UPI000A29D3F7|nr:transcription initiation factor TFIID subunit 6b isoform X2 [Arabidopsis lyrata subsp. lyrata]|eukprot:XP_020869430.1 transcription initiation factor TFIID subunit 6b isoform X2 [Arabidopsis lyrata subsp. lyrata]
MVTKESIEVIAQSIGLSSLSPEVSAALAPDVEYRVLEVMQEAIKCMRHARRTTLMAHDVDSALHFRNLEPTSGSKSMRFKRAPENRDLYFLDDKDVELKNVIEAPLPNAPPDASIFSHWLAIDGIQPSIPQNSHLQAISDLKRSEYKDDGLAARQIYFDKVTEWALTQSGSTLFRQALSSLETDPGLHPLVPFFTSFIAEEIVRNMDNYPILLALMRLARSLLHNPHVHIEPYLHQFMPSIITCLIAKSLGRKSSDNHWHLRNFTASTVASTCKRYGHVYHNLLPRVTRSLLHTFLDPTKALPQHYGAIQGMVALGLNMVRFLVLPNLGPYLLLLLPEMEPEKQKDEAKRHGAWLVYGALMVAAGRCLYERLKSSETLLSPPNSSVWKTNGKLTSPRQSKRKASSDNLTHQPPLKKIAVGGIIQMSSAQMQMHGTTTVPQQSLVGRDIARRTSAALGTDVDNYLFPLFEYFGESMLMFTPKHELSFFL